MASNNLIVCYGTEAVPWSDFIKWVLRYQNRYPEDTAVKRMLILDDYRQSRYKTGSIFTLSALLDSFGDAFTSSNRNGTYHEKVYAFLGLAHDIPRGTFPVSYRKSAADLPRSDGLFLQ